MSSQCKLPCLPPPACTGETVPPTCPSLCAVLDPDACPIQDTHPCPEQTFPVEPCQGAATCLDACPQVGLPCPIPAVPVPGDACCPEHTDAWDSCAPPCVGAHVCAAAIPCDPPQSKGGISFPAQPTGFSVEPCTPETHVETSQLVISPVDPCIPGTAGTCVETFPVTCPTSATDPCPLKMVETCVKTFPLQHTIPTVELFPTDTAGTCMETSPLQQATSPVEPCTLEAAGTDMEDVPLQYPVSVTEPCILEVLETCSEEPCSAQGAMGGDPCPNQCSATCLDPCTPQSTICTEPCASQSAAEPTGTCTPLSTVELCTPQSTLSTVELCTPQSTLSTVELCTPQSTLSTVELCTPQSIPGPTGTKGTAKGASARPSPRAPFRLNTRTAAIVERCLSRCQSWLRGKK